MRRKITFVIVSLAILASAYWLFSHSRLEITINSGSQNTNYSYQLYNQGNGKTESIKTSSKTLSKIVGKGTYEILVTSDETSYVAVVKVSGFLRTTKIHGDLRPEQTRHFVGNEPKDCTNYIQSVLISYNCGDLYSNIQTHQPADASQPTYTQKNTATGLSGYVEGIINSAESDLVLIKTIPTSEEQPDDGHILYRIDKEMRLTDPVSLTSLSSEKVYSISQYKNGFVVFELTAPQAIYYPSARSNPTELKLEQPTDNSLYPVAMSVYGDSLLSVYSNKPSDRNNRSEIVVYSSQATSSHHHLKGSLTTSTVLCGTKVLCTLTNNRLDVFSLKTEKPQLLFNLFGVTDVDNFASETRVITSKGVVKLDVDSRSGFYEYSFGDYSYNNISGDSTGYTLSINNSKQQKVAVRIDKARVNTDSIDKKVSELQGMAEVLFVSVYGNYIYISANLGDLVYDSVTGSYVYNGVIKKAVANKINAEIDKLGIDRKVYTITSNAF
ncbi:hypothetical protein A3F38_02320 [Candidatus Saccharibacteria bacterium RIFCSPHIGHO2_12_FULL_48_21]|nr:MAG: hypothetical protein A3F38_02320 [Candidatus Saccharibacteria bacterium RIFCSPHIGHO2_12_FULL_48_21]